jgi:serine/threonine-protein kinase
VSSQHRIGQYNIVRKIGAGGMGVVYAAEHVLLGRRAAIKTLLPSLSAQPRIVERFFHEARATSAIEDPGIVQVFDFGYHVDGTAYIVMELLEGESLLDRLERVKTLPAPTALRIARQVASSLAAAHARDIVHRDLKPENIYLIGDREARGGERTKVLDFGICKIGEGDDGENAVFGTPVYMSPEQCRGSAYVDHRTDIYALGCVLFEMLTGRPPFEGETVEDVVEAHQVTVPPPASALITGIPPAVDALLRRCLAKSPDDRYQTMAALGEALERRGEEPGGVVVVRPASTEPRRTPPPPAAPVSLGSGFGACLGGTVVSRGRASAARAEGAEADAAPRRTSLRRAAIGVALLVAAGGVMAVTRFTGGEAPIAAATPAAFEVEPAAAPPEPPGAPEARRASAEPAGAPGQLESPGGPIAARPSPEESPGVPIVSPPPLRGTAGRGGPPARAPNRTAAAARPASSIEDLYDSR